MPIQAGQSIVGGKYHILSLIGEGGMARVWLAEEPRFASRHVAIKEPRADLPPRLLEEVHERYTREVQVCAALQQAKTPNIVPAITTELHEDTLLLVMEYMPGGDLAALLKRHPDGLSPEHAVAIAWDILVALEGVHTHELDIVHRDVKPSNILFDQDPLEGTVGHAHLADFGLAQLPGISGRSQFQGGQHPGTPMYMAPEQGRSPDPLIPAADLYALGCILFEMLSGRRYKRERPGTKPSDLRAEVPVWLDAIVAKALQENPWDRYRDAGEMAAALERGKEEACRQAAARRQAAAQAQRQAEEARQEKLANLYDQLRAREQAEDWTGAVELARQLEAEQASYRDVGQRLAQAERKSKEEAERARREAAERERQAELTHLYQELLASERKENWAAVLDLGQQLEAKEPDYQDARTHMARAEQELAPKQATPAVPETMTARRPTPATAKPTSAATRPVARRPLPGWAWVGGVLLGGVALIVLLVLTGAIPSGSELKCEDEWGCVEVSPGEPIQIGSIFVLSGPNQALGLDTRRGVEMAAQDKDQILGHAIEVAFEDSMCTAEGGQIAAQKLAADARIVSIIGTNCSSAARAAIPVVCEANVTMVSPSNVGIDLTSPDRPADYHCYLRTSYNDRIQGTLAADFAWEYLSITKAGTIYDNSLYTEQLQQAFADRFKELGGKIMAQESIQPTDTNMYPVLSRIAATGPDLIYYPLFIAAGGYITSQARQTPGVENVYLIGSDATFSPDFWEAAGTAAAGMYHSSPDFTQFGAAYQAFTQRYEATYGEKPIAPFHGHAYDAASLIFQAIERVALDAEDGTLLIGRKALRDALYATNDYPGLTGNLTCDDYGDCGDPKIAIYETFDPDPTNWDPGSGADHDPRRVWP